VRASVLKIPAFRALWLGQAISQLGDAFYYLIFMFMVQKVTGSSAMVGLVGALETIPYLIFGPYAGVLADRLDRRRIMMFSDLASGMCLVGLAASIWVFGKPPLAALFVAPFVLSSVRCFFMPAKSAAIPRLVPGDKVLEANSISMTTQTVMPLISLGLSASVLSLLFGLSPMLFYLSAVGLNSLSFFGSAAFISRLPVLRADRTRGHDSHSFSDFKEGLRYINGRHDLKVLTVLLTVFRLSVAPFFVVYLAANEQWFGGKPQTIAWFEFSFFAGMVAASLVMGRQRPQRPLYWFATGLAICGASVAAMAFTPYVWLFILWNAIAGLALPPGEIAAATYLQLSVPDGFRGRVNSVRDTISQGVMPIGLYLGGILVARCGLVTAFLVMGIGMFGACLVGFFDRGFREARMPRSEPVESPAPAAEVAFTA
jgi:MFS family permease